MEENKAVVTKVCYMYARDSEHFKDLYQETLINIWQALPRFKKEAALSTWIYRITINTCISHFRRQRKHSSNISLEQDSMMELADKATDDHEHAACLREMYQLINRLPALDKAIVLMWLDEKSYQEIADNLGRHVKSIDNALQRVKRKLERYLEDMEAQNND